MSNKNLRHLSLLVTSQTAYNLQRLAQMAGYREIGRVVDKLVREKMITLKGGDANDLPGKSRVAEKLPDYRRKNWEPNR